MSHHNKRLTFSKHNPALVEADDDTAGEPADAPSPVRSLSSEVVPPSEDDEMELGESPLVKATSATSLEPFIIAEPAEEHTQKEEDSDEYASDDMEYTEM